MKLHINRSKHPDVHEALMMMSMGFRHVLGKKQRKRIFRLAKQFDGQRDEVVISGYEREFVSQVAVHFADKADEERYEFFHHSNWLINVYRRVRYWKEEKLAKQRVRGLRTLGAAVEARRAT